MWSLALLSTNRSDGILLQYQQIPYTGDTTVKLYRNTNSVTPIFLTELPHSSIFEEYLDTTCDVNVDYCYWFKGEPSGEWGGPFCGGRRIGPAPVNSSSSSMSSLSSGEPPVPPTLSSSSSSSSSSFGNAVGLFYFVDKNGDLYLFSANEHRAESSLIFKSFSPIINPPMGLAISYFPFDESSSSSEILTSSSSSFSSLSSTSGTSSSSSINSSSSSTSISSSSESSSLSSQSKIIYDYNVYILRKRDNRIANLAIHDITGYKKGSIDFSSSINFLGLCVWPGNNNLLIGISENSIHLLYISAGQIGMYSFDSPVPLTYGICVKDVIDGNSAEFFVRRKDQREIVLITINKKSQTCFVTNQYFCPLSKWQRLGGISCNLGVYGLIGEMNTIYHVVEEEKGYSHVSKTVILTGIPTLSYMFAMPFTVYGVSIPVLGSTSTSLIESVKEPTLIFRQYDINGNFIGNFNSLYMGNMQVGVKSGITVVNMLVEGVTSIANVKLGIIENGISGSTVNEVVMYGVLETIDPSFTPTKYFPGINTDGTADNANNIVVGVKTADKVLESQYVYLKIDMPKKYVGRGYVTFRWWFDYE